MSRFVRPLDARAAQTFPGRRNGGPQLDVIDNFFALRRDVEPGCALFHAGGEFKALYRIRRGFFKTICTDDEGREQVLGFFMPHQLLGLDAIGVQRHNVTAVALEESEVSVLPERLLHEVAQHAPQLYPQLFKALSEEIVHHQRALVVLGSLGASQRIAAFLIGLARRLGHADEAVRVFDLPMARHEIGSYLGLSVETVSRTLSAFQAAGLIEVHLKHMEIRDVEGLAGTLVVREPQRGKRRRRSYAR